MEVELVTFTIWIGNIYLLLFTGDVSTIKCDHVAWKCAQIFTWEEGQC